MKRSTGGLVRLERTSVKEGSLFSRLEGSSSLSMACRSSTFNGMKKSNRLCNPGVWNQPTAMSFTKAFSPALRELRILCSQTGPQSAGTRSVSHFHVSLLLTLFCRQFILNRYAAIKDLNPDLPVLIREANGTPARVFARFGTSQNNSSSVVLIFVITSERGVEKHAELENLSVSEVESKVAQLIGSS